MCAYTSSCDRRSRWVNPHNPCLTMFANSSIHVLPLDPRFGCDHARLYAAKYCSKPEKFYYLEGQRDGVKSFLQCLALSLSSMLHCASLRVWSGLSPETPKAEQSAHALLCPASWASTW